MRMSVLVLTGLLAACNSDGTGSEDAADGVPSLAPLPAVTMPAYKLVGSGPIVILLVSDIASALVPTGPYDYVTRLHAAGFSVLTLDLPCEGANADHSSPAVLNDALLCWAVSIAGGDRDIFLRFCSGLLDVLDVLDQPVAGIIGISRGAYVSSTCAAYDYRIKNLALISPLTDLNYLSEFAGWQVNEAEFGLQQFYPELREKHILVRVGKDAHRVGTANAVAFAESVGATLQVLNTIGHNAPEDGTTIVWLQEQLSVEGPLRPWSAP
jgi:hypothetical protein